MTTTAYAAGYARWQRIVDAAKANPLTDDEVIRAAADGPVPIVSVSGATSGTWGAAWITDLVKDWPVDSLEPRGPGVAQLLETDTRPDEVFVESLRWLIWFRHLSVTGSRLDPRLELRRKSRLASTHHGVSHYESWGGAYVHLRSL